MRKSELSSGAPYESSDAERAVPTPATGHRSDLAAWSGVPESGWVESMRMATKGEPTVMQGLVVDWGSVLTTSIDEAIASWLAWEGIAWDAFASVMRSLHDESDSALHRLETGRLARRDFEVHLAERLASATGRPVDPEDLADRMLRDLHPNEPLRGIVRECRSRGWRTAMLSNSWGFDYDEDDLGTLFDSLLISDRIGLRKPDAPAFEAALQALDLPAQSCVMIDDLRRNIKAAEALGMRGFLYRHGSEAELRAFLGLPLSHSRISEPLGDEGR